MSFLGWLAAAGALFLLMALSSGTIRRMPITSSAIYLALGIAVGPLGLGWLRVDVTTAYPWLLRLTEVAVIVSLFIGGLRLRLPARHAAWSPPVRLAGPVMILSIAGVAALAHVALGLGAAAALLLGAVIAPTDPVLAGEVKVSHAADEDRVRYGLSGEAGLNDGAAFPFVVLALGLAERGGGSWIAGWAAHRLVWSIAAALILGYLLGKGMGWGAIKLRSVQRESDAPTDFLALALIALAYVSAETISAWGFLAVFAAGLGLRSAELSVVRQHPHPEAADNGGVHPPAETLVGTRVDEEALAQPAVAAGAVVAETLSFGDTVERLLEVLLVVLVGVALATHWDARGLLVAAVLFVVIRPLATALALVGTDTTRWQRFLMGWFGVRGIGSLYYLSYAMAHGLGGGEARDLVGITITTVAASIVVHGVTGQPLLDPRYLRAWAPWRTPSSDCRSS